MAQPPDPDALQLPTLRHIPESDGERHPCGKCGAPAIQEATVGTLSRKTLFYFCFEHALTVAEA